MIIITEKFIGGDDADIDPLGDRLTLVVILRVLFFGNFMILCEESESSLK